MPGKEKFEGGAEAPPSWSKGKSLRYCLLTASR